jgi:hypothetical protein
MKQMTKILLLCILIIGCSSDYKVKTGFYVSKPYSRIESIFKMYFCGYKAFLCGSRLILYPDSTFIYERFPFISSGSWFQDKDSLALRFNGYSWMNDSLKSLYPKDKIPVFNSDPRRFKVEKDYLFRKIKLKDNKYVMERLLCKSP